MAELINCPTCDKQVSSEAAACPECGHPLTPSAPAPERKKKFSLVRVLVLLGAVLGLIVIWNPSGAKDTAGRLLSGGEQVVVDEEFGVPAKSWQMRVFRVKRAAVIEVSVRSDGDGVNVYLQSEKHYKEFEAANKALFGGEYHHYQDFYMPRAKRNTEKGRLGSGTYYVVIENLAKASFNVHLKIVVRQYERRAGTVARAG